MKRLDPARDFITLTDRNKVFMGERVKMRHVHSVDEFYHEINITSIIDESAIRGIINGMTQWVSYFGYSDIFMNKIKPL